MPRCRLAWTLKIESALHRIDTILGDVDNKLATRGAAGTFFSDVDGDVGANQAAKAPPELFATRPPLEKTFEHALNPQLYLDDVVKYYGINLRGVKAVYDPTLEPGKLGVTRANEGGMVIRIGRDAFVDEPTLANTVAHELSHARDYQRGAHKEHGDASSMGDGTVYGAGNALERMIRKALGGEQ